MINNPLIISFKFFYLTDGSNEFFHELNVLDLGIKECLKRWWYKLQSFKKDFYGFSGPTMFLDLDVVKINNINALFETQKDNSMIIHDLEPDNVYNSSVFKLERGSQPHVWDQFLLDKESIISRMYGDQDWISEVANDAMLWPNNWIVSFKKECNAHIQYSLSSLGRFFRSKGFFLPKWNAMQPKKAKIVYFHGKPGSHDIANQPYNMWKKAHCIKKEWRVWQ
jgi:hypothetical protein